MLQDNKNISSNMTTNQKDFFFSFYVLILFLLNESKVYYSQFIQAIFSKCFSSTS